MPPASKKPKQPAQRSDASTRKLVEWLLEKGKENNLAQLKVAEVEIVWFPHQYSDGGVDLPTRQGEPDMVGDYETHNPDNLDVDDLSPGDPLWDSADPEPD